MADQQAVEHRPQRIDVRIGGQVISLLRGCKPVRFSGQDGLDILAKNAKGRNHHLVGTREHKGREGEAAPAQVDERSTSLKVVPVADCLAYLVHPERGGRFVEPASDGDHEGQRLPLHREDEIVPAVVLEVLANAGRPGAEAKDLRRFPDDQALQAEQVGCQVRCSVLARAKHLLDFVLFLQDSSNF